MGRNEAEYIVKGLQQDEESARASVYVPAKIILLTNCLIAITIATNNQFFSPSSLLEKSFILCNSALTEI